MARRTATKWHAASKSFSASEQVFFQQQRKPHSFHLGLAGRPHRYRPRRKVLTILCHQGRTSARTIAGAGAQIGRGELRHSCFRKYESHRAGQKAASGKLLVHIKFTHYLRLPDFVFCCRAAYSSSFVPAFRRHLCLVRFAKSAKPPASAPPKAKRSAPSAAAPNAKSPSIARSTARIS